VPKKMYSDSSTSKDFAMAANQRTPQCTKYVGDKTGEIEVADFSHIFVPRHFERFFKGAWGVFVIILVVY